MSNRIHIDELIDSSPIGALQWRVVVLCFILAVIDGFDLIIIAFVAPLLADEFTLSPGLQGQLLSASLIGLMVGAFAGSPFADKFGRKPVIILSVAVMGIFALFTAFSESTFELFLYRFLTGLGLGALMPSINILTAEFAPMRHRALLMTVMFVGLPAGTILGGAVSARLVSQFGWESVFLVGGILPLLLVPILVFLLPESPRFLAQKGGRTATLAEIVNRIAPDVLARSDSQFESLVPRQEDGGIRALFTEGRNKITLLLWIVFFANLLTINALLGWLPLPIERNRLSNRTRHSHYPRVQYRRRHWGVGARRGYRPIWNGSHHAGVLPSRRGGRAVGGTGHKFAELTIDHPLLRGSHRHGMPIRAQCHGQREL